MFWFRRDLRLGDNPALTTAVALARERGGGLLPAFVPEPQVRPQRAPGGAARWWLWHSLGALDGELRRLPRGTALSAELTQGWPYSNRRALASTGKVRFTEPEAGAAELMS